MGTMQIVVISHNQLDHITEMLEILKEHNIVYVLDRCNDGSNEYNFPPNVKVVKNDTGTGFLAGRMRDLGANQHDKTKSILFLDGDKVPAGDLNYLESLEYDVTCLGIENDRRPWINDGDGTIPWQLFGDPVNPHNGIYSCGIYLKPSAIEACTKNGNGRIFHPAFDGYWGEEDRYLGDVVNRAKLSIGYTNKIKLKGELTSESDILKKIERNFMVRLKLNGLI